MYMEKPVSSKICRMRNYVRQYERHRKKLRNIKPSIDATPPKRYSHLERNLKRVQHDREKYRKIKKENDLLISKIGLIMTRKSRIDNRASKHSVRIGHRAVNRKKELARINKENKRIIKRLHERQPYYNHLEWKQEAKRMEYYCKNICQHEYTLGKNKKKRRTTLSNTIHVIRRNPKKSSRKSTRSKSTRKTTRMKRKKSKRKKIVKNLKKEVKKKKQVEEKKVENVEEKKEEVPVPLENKDDKVEELKE